MEGWLDSTLGSPPVRRHKTRHRPDPLSEARLQTTGGRGGVRLSHGEPASVRVEVRGDSRKKYLRWNTFNQNQSDALLREVRSPVRVFPDTRKPEEELANATHIELTEASKRFLDDHPVLLHVPFEIVSEEIASVEAERRLPVWDPYLGNRIEGAWAKIHERSTKMGVLAFPMGAVGHELNVSPVYASGRQAVADDVFTPCARPAATFATPIQQITASPYQIDISLETTKPVFAVRTHSETAILLFSINPTHRPHDSSLSVIVQELGLISMSETSGRRQMDIAMSPFEAARALIVDDEGQIYEWRGINKYGQKKPDLTTRRVRSAVSPDGVKAREFYRIKYGPSESSALLMSDRTVQHFDLRAPDQETLVYDLDSSTAILTSFDRRHQTDSRELELLCFSTTESVNWVDLRMPGKVVASIEHHRAFDRTLELLSSEICGQPLTLLTSRVNDLVTAYNVTGEGSTTVQSLGDPYALSPPPTAFTRAGSTLFRHPSLPAEDERVSFFELSDRGGVVMRKLGHKRGAEQTGFGARNAKALRDGFEWLPDVKKLAAEVEEEEEIGWLAQRRSKIVDLRARYEEAFRVQPSDLEMNLDLFMDAEAVFQDQDAPLQRMVTARDILLLSSTSDAPILRSDFVAGSSIQPPVGQLLEVSAQLAQTDFGKGATFQHSLINRISSLLDLPPNYPAPLIANADETAARLRFDYNLVDADPEHSVPTDVFASHACDVLALDLSLSASVYTSDPITPAVLSADDELAQATQSLSLSRPTAPLSYSFIRPVLRKPLPTEDRSYGLEGSPTARLLISKWVVGDDPSDYCHVDLRQGAPLSSQPNVDDDDGLPALTSSYLPTRSSQVIPQVIATQPSPSPEPTIHVWGGNRRRTGNIPIAVPSSDFDPFPVASQPALLPYRKRALPGSGVAESQQASPLRRVGSQPDMGFSQSDIWSDAGPSTQAEPGPYGDRYGRSKSERGHKRKKGGPKKRAGGF